MAPPQSRKRSRPGTRLRLRAGCAGLRAGGAGLRAGGAGPGLSLSCRVRDIRLGRLLRAEEPPPPATLHRPLFLSRSLSDTHTHTHTQPHTRPKSRMTRRARRIRTVPVDSFLARRRGRGS